VDWDGWDGWSHVVVGERKERKGCQSWIYDIRQDEMRWERSKTICLHSLAYFGIFFIVISG
jgi:hypothetical protein